MNMSTISHGFHADSLNEVNTRLSIAFARMVNELEASKNILPESKAEEIEQVINVIDNAVSVAFNTIKTYAPDYIIRHTHITIN